MSIYLRDNPFSGINPVLHSYLQQPGGDWRTFHTEHLVTLRRQLDDILPPNYHAQAEQSLQVTLETTDFEETRRTVSDVTILHAGTGPAITSTSAQASTPLISLPAAMPLPPEAEPIAVVIYRITSTGDRQPITRIELLSPANLPGGSHHLSYRVLRNRTLESGIHVVELDYLHEAPPLRADLPQYRRGEPNALPYYVYVTDARSDTTDVYGVGVMQPLPQIRVPLADEDAITLDLNAAYQATYRDVRVFWQNMADHAADPVTIDRYTDHDQRQIRERLAEIRTTHADEAE